MTVHEFIKLLEEYPSNLKVEFKRGDLITSGVQMVVDKTENFEPCLLIIPRKCVNTGEIMFTE